MNRMSPHSFPSSRQSHRQQPLRNDAIPARQDRALAAKCSGKVTAVGFEPTHPKIVELESTALDHSAKLS